MPRDLSGNYTLPAGNPVVPGTLIIDTWANPTMGDIANQLNGVITRDGLMAATGPIKFAEGTPAAPGITFANQTNTGWWANATSAGFTYKGLAAWTFSNLGSALSSGLTLGASAPVNPNAILEMVTTSKGMVLPRLTSQQKQNIPAYGGMMVYDTDLGVLSCGKVSATPQGLLWVLKALSATLAQLVQLDLRG
jgi:hypothetical protein